MTIVASDSQVKTDSAGTAGAAGAGTGTASGGAMDWRAGWSDDLKNDATLSTFKDPQALAKSYLEARRMIGSNKVSLPGADATPEQRDQFYKALGRPDKPEEYEWPTEGLPEGPALTDKAKERIAKAAHQVGLPKREGAMLYRMVAQMAAEDVAAQAQAQQQFAQETEQGLRREWGAAYDQNWKLAERAVGHFIGKEFTEQLKFTNPAIIKGYAKIGKMIAEDEVRGAGAGAAPMMSPQQATEALANFEKANAAALRNSSNPKHGEIKAEWEKLKANKFQTIKASQEA